MALSIPAIVDWVIAPPPAAVIVQALRFRFTPLAVPKITVETLMDVPARTTPTQARSVAQETVISFVERAFEIKRSQWEQTIDEDLEITYGTAGTTMKFDTVNDFVRSFTFANVAGVPSLIDDAHNAAGPILIQTWIEFLNAINNLIRLNK